MRRNRLPFPRRLELALLVVGWSLCTATWAQEQEEEEPRQETRADILREMRNQRITVHGVVLDQNDQPVPGASVRLSYTSMGEFTSQLKRSWVKSDAKGKWTFSARAYRMFLHEVRKDGYRYDPEQNDVDADFGDLDDDEPNSPEQPFVVRLQRLGAP